MLEFREKSGNISPESKHYATQYKDYIYPLLDSDLITFEEKIEKH